MEDTLSLETSLSKFLSTKLREMINSELGCNELSLAELLLKQSADSFNFE